MTRPNTIADGLQGRLGDLTWPIVRDLVDEVITISDQEILGAMQICFERMKVRAHPIPETSPWHSSFWADRLLDHAMAYSYLGQTSAAAAHGQ